MAFKLVEKYDALQDTRGRCSFEKLRREVSGTQVRCDGQTGHFGYGAKLNTSDSRDTDAKVIRRLPGGTKTCICTVRTSNREVQVHFAGRRTDF